MDDELEEEETTPQLVPQELPASEGDPQQESEMEPIEAPCPPHHISGTMEGPEANPDRPEEELPIFFIGNNSHSNKSGTSGGSALGEGLPGNNREDFLGKLRPPQPPDKSISAL